MTLECDASRSADPDGHIVQFSWDFGDGSSIKESSFPTRTPALAITPSGSPWPTSTRSAIPSNAPPSSTGRSVAVTV